MGSASRAVSESALSCRGKGGMSADIGSRVPTGGTRKATPAIDTGILSSILHDVGLSSETLVNTSAIAVFSSTIAHFRYIQLSVEGAYDHSLRHALLRRLKRGSRA